MGADGPPDVPPRLARRKIPAAPKIVPAMPERPFLILELIKAAGTKRARGEMNMNAAARE